MSTPNNGGPAFPVDEFCYDGDRSRLYGMSLRDYFAAAALQGVLANPARFDGWTESAERAYRFADAMLEQREVKP
jgi:hypothetical protein